LEIIIVNITAEHYFYFCNDFSAHQMHLPGDINGAAGFTNKLDGHLA
jgi:hypothetical protein